MKTFNEGKGTCDSCWLAIDAPNGGYICMEQIGKSLFEMPGCPGAITDEIVRKAQPAALKSRPAAGPEQLFKTKAEVEALHEMEKTYFAGFESGVRYASENAAEKEQPLGTVAEPADPPPASELPPKIGKAKIKVKIAMNIDLIAEYFHYVAWLHTEEKEVNKHPAGYFRLAAQRQVQRLQQKIKFCLEEEIMEKLMAK